MKKTSDKKNSYDLRPEYDLSKLKGGVRGKYYRQATGMTDLIPARPEIISDSEPAGLEDDNEHIQECQRNNAPNG